MAAVMATVLEAKELYRFFHTAEEETLALRGVSLAVGAGEIVAGVGPAGAGKATLLGVPAGRDEADLGKEMVGGGVPPRRAPYHRARHPGPPHGHACLLAG